MMIECQEQIDCDLCDTMITVDDAITRLSMIGLNPIINGNELSYATKDNGWGVGKMFVAWVQRGWVSVEATNRQLAGYGNGRMCI